jgi:hypothetical protein
LVLTDMLCQSGRIGDSGSQGNQNKQGADHGAVPLGEIQLVE